MKYVLFVLGLLLLLVGSYFVYVGSHIIEIERGWASVIAGTTAVVGGLLTLGLVWIIKTLEQLRMIIQAQEMMSLAVRTAIPTALHTSEAPASRTLGSAADLPVPMTAWPPHTEAVRDHVTTKKEFAEAASSHGEPSHVETWPVVETFEMSDYDSSSVKIKDTAQPQVKEKPPVAMRPEFSSSIKGFWQRVTKTSNAFRPAAKPAAEQEPAEEAAPPLTAPVSEPIALAEAQTEARRTMEISGDWLDHALADLDAAIAQTPHPADAAATEHPTPPEAETYIDIHLDETVQLAETVHVEQAVDVDEAVQQHETPPPAPEPVPSEPLTAAAEEPAVIGRYEAEGTTYIMFADGSIEAQSERGVARFKSMADLKAYFESQEAI